MNILKDNVPKLVRKLAIPAMVGTLFQTLYNIVDTFLHTCLRNHKPKFYTHFYTLVDTNIFKIFFTHIFTDAYAHI